MNNAAQLEAQLQADYWAFAECQCNLRWKGRARILSSKRPSAEGWGPIRLLLSKLCCCQILFCGGDESPALVCAFLAWMPGNGRKFRNVNGIKPGLATKLMNAMPHNKFAKVRFFADCLLKRQVCDCFEYATKKLK